VAVDAGAVLKLTEGIVRDTTTGAGTTSRVDGAVCLPSGVALTNEAGSVFSGSGVVTGSVVFAEGSVWALDKGAYAGPLHVTGTATFDPGAMVQLTGYTMAELVSGIALVRAVDDGIVQASGMVPVTLDGVSHPDWWAKPSSDKKTFVARVFPKGTLMALL